MPQIHTTTTKCNKYNINKAYNSILYHEYIMQKGKTGILNPKHITKIEGSELDIETLNNYVGRVKKSEIRKLMMITTTFGFHCIDNSIFSESFFMCYKMHKYVFGLYKYGLIHPNSYIFPEKQITYINYLCGSLSEISVKYNRVKKIIKYCPDVDINIPEIHGYTPLALARMHREIDLILILLSHGAIADMPHGSYIFETDIFNYNTSRSIYEIDRNINSSGEIWDYICDSYRDHCVLDHHYIHNSKKLMKYYKCTQYVQKYYSNNNAIYHAANSLLNYIDNLISARDEIRQFINSQSAFTWDNSNLLFTGMKK